MTATSTVLVASATRQVGRSDRTYSVMHLPTDDNAGAWCDWPGPLTAMTVTQAVALHAVSCNRCPLIKAARTRP